MPALTRRATLKGGAALAAAATLPRVGRGAGPPNVLFIMADQWRAQAFSHAGDPNVRTPNIDRLATESAHLRRGYVANPLCGPNRATILTGRYSHQHGLVKNHTRLARRQVSIAEVFRDAGYRTHYIGKWHLDGKSTPGFVPAKRRQGFQTLRGFNRGHDYRGWTMFESSGRKRRFKKYQPIVQTDMTLRFLEQPRQEPFFCVLAWGPPHTPYDEIPRRYRRLDPNGTLDFRPNVPAGFRGSDRHREWIAGYSALGESLDREIRRLIRGLDDQGLGRDTLVVFTSDHGDLLGSHFAINPNTDQPFRKGLPYEEALGVPLLFRWPGMIDPGPRNSLVNSVDLMPTILGLCGLPIPASVAGLDLSGHLLGAAPAARSIYCQGLIDNRNEWRAVVTERHKLIFWVKEDRLSLYELDQDPFEQVDAAGARPKLRDRLFDELRAWATDIGDPVFA